MEAALQAVLAATASFFVITVIFAVIYIICKVRNRQYSQNCVRTRNVPNVASESASFDPSLNQIAMGELLLATRDFSPELIVGDGSFGLVYKARLFNGVTVAVKKLGSDAFQGFREFRAEMETLSKIRHPNIVKILGYYATGSDRVLVYEFIEKGSLDQWLHDTSPSTEHDASAARLPLPWETRIKIIKGVANGLLYLHNLETPIIHRDIKASNVLLDSEFEPHIADFGLARRVEGSHSHVSTQVAGTMGYMPPEYIHGATTATVMGDVYSFGILMLEIATGRRPSWPFKEDDGKEVRLVEWATNMVKQNRQMEMLDDRISRDGLKEDGVVEFLRIATWCINETCSISEADVSAPLVKGLSWNFHHSSCPKLESLVRKHLKKVFKEDIGQAAGLLRLHFHDCFVQGCDGSVLLDGSSCGPSEQDAPPNLSLRAEAFEIINDLRHLVHNECGRVVSCADLVALAARDAVYLSGGPDYDVPLGRRDGLHFASRQATIDNLPPPTSNTSFLIESLSSKKLDATDIVALSGGHTIGLSHCPAFTPRLYPTQDPTMDEDLASELKEICPTENSTATTVMDIRTPNHFDNKYYVGLVNRQGLFTSDQDLYMDSRTRDIVTSFAEDQSVFFEQFVLSMIKMGQLSVLTGRHGEIRANCSVRNSDNKSYLAYLVDDEESKSEL
ncbi:hypothetical protein F0562_027483 [Nyssa sinensis]|uniref:peroxidase n=1 Tax=Nyssa sinensis TaxID=561372 RepID=A0A5J5B872_9ASTE|nr:hypothetical protein F0562_027483 [Nyssa sinensis]